MSLRFAPSPTGLLHLGNAFIALINWLLARQRGQPFLLRLDDTDAERSRAEHAVAIEEDLRWLGLDWDGFLRQSDRLDRYAAAADRLRAAGRLYPCLESEEELRVKRELRLRQGRPPVYDRGALRMTAEQLARAEANGKRPYWRFLLSAETVAWEDGVLGRRTVKLPSLSDPVLVRADGTPLYTLTSAVDDLETGITLVARGEDHVTNTGVQIDLMRALGGAIPAFAHLPLLLDAAGAPLSKRTGGMALRQLRRDGVEPEAVAGLLAAIAGGRDHVAAKPAELVAGFDLSAITSSAPRFDPRALLALNRRHLRGLPFAAVRDRLPPGADAAFWESVRGNLDLLTEARGWWEVTNGTVVPPPAGEDAAFLRTALELLPPEPWDATTWTGWTTALRERTGRKGKALFHPLRLALTGEDGGPELAGLLPLIGHARTAERLRVAGG